MIRANTRFPRPFLRATGETSSITLIMGQFDIRHAFSSLAATCTLGQVKITLAPDGSKLVLEYSEASEPGAELFFHYVISPQSRPRIITGYSPHSVDTEQEIDYREIPVEVLREARSWLESNLAVAHQRDISLARLLSQYLSVLNEKHG
jgi:hypothetical protein